MKFLPLLLLSCAMGFSGITCAEIYKRVDADGHVTYSSAPIKGSKKLLLEPLPTMTPQAKPRARSEGFPKVDSRTQTKRDDTRRKILEDELAIEAASLDDARTRLKEAEDTPEVYKTADGQTLRNMAKYEEKVNTHRDEVELHENNIRALKTELSNLK